MPVGSQCLLCARKRSNVGIRTRKVRCGEQRPNCHNCKRLGVQCTGYAKPYRSPATGRALAPLLRATSYGAVFTNEKEISMFQFFMEKTFKWLHTASAGYSDLCSRSWGEALQMMHYKPAMKHLILVTSAAFSHFASEGQSRRLKGQNDEDVFLLQHYGAALKNLREKIDEQDVDVIILASCILCVVELFRNRTRIFRQHLEAGLKILTAYRQRRSPIGSELSGQEPLSGYSSNDPCYNRIEQTIVPTIEAIHDKADRMSSGTYTVYKKL